MKVIITQSNYIPWKGYFDSIKKVDHFVIFDDMQYTKRDWRNRNKIKTKDGAKWLSIPVEVKGKYFQKINETTVAENDWGKKHWNTIYHSYSKAPFFKDYEEVFSELYLNASDNLTEINYSFIKAICDILSIKTVFTDSREYNLLEGKTERLVSICKQLNATDYYTGPAAKSYMEESLFEQENIKVHYFDYGQYPEYPQLYGGFVHEVTILDLLFNVGIDAKKYLKSFYI